MRTHHRDIVNLFILSMENERTLRHWVQVQNPPPLPKCMSAKGEINPSSYAQVAGNERGKSKVEGKSKVAFYLIKGLAFYGLGAETETNQSKVLVKSFILIFCMKYPKNLD